MKEYSKLLTNIALILYVGTLIFSLGMMGFLIITGSSNVYDFAIFTIAISSTSTVYGFVCKHYYNKAGLQNCTSIRKSFYQEAMQIRLDYVERCIQIMQKYDVTQEQIAEIESEAPFSDMSDQAINRIIGTIDQAEDNSTVNEEIGG